MFKIIFIFMPLFLALASLTALKHLFLNHFIMKHRDTLSLTKNINVSFGFTYMAEWQIKDDTYINVGHCFSDIYGQIIVGHCLSDIYRKSKLSILQNVFTYTVVLLCS